jgi:alcohol dehydrogenase class IV
MEYSFDTPPTVLFGAGARFRLPDELKRLGLGRVLLVSDAYLVQTGLVDTVQKQLRDKGIESKVFSDVQPDPTDVNVIAGLKVLKECGAEAAVAIGGGSVIDAAKIIAIAVRNPEPLPAFQGYHRILKPGIPLVVIPTTAGTGSEATKAAVITDTQRQVKMMILDRKIMPRTSIVDYELSLTMPKSLTAYVGIDTLVHAIEAYVSKKSFGMTDTLALSCIRLTSRYLPVAYKDGGNREAREAMALAACQGGMAFTNSSVCLVHGMSRPIGAVFHLPHGLSNAVLLPAITRVSSPGGRARYARVSREMGLASENQSDDIACDVLVAGLERFNSQLGVTRLRDYIAKTQAEFEGALPKMAEDALASGSPQNNPVVPTADEIVQLYKDAW